MDKQNTPSHENYRTLLEKARIWDGLHKCYFCPDCRRYVPKKDAKDPCVFCGSTNYNLSNPLIGQIIKTDVLKQFMFETFQYCIEPFTAFDKRYWKDGCFFYKKKDGIHREIGNRENYFLKNMELWCVSRRGFGGYFLSLCVRWTEETILDGKSGELTYLKYITFKSPRLILDNNDEKDDSFYFNMIFEDLISNIRSDGLMLTFKAINENCIEYEENARGLFCSDAMWISGDKLIGLMSSENLLRNSLIPLYLALDDFSMIPRYWGYEGDD